MAFAEPVIDRLTSFAQDDPGKFIAKADFAILELI